MPDDFSAWIGTQETASDTIEASRGNALLAALGQEPHLKNGDVLPPLFHWLYFWNVQPPTSLGADGHPAKGQFLPPIPLPRRMWAGGALTFVRPLRVGDVVSRRSTVSRVESKMGKSGALFFVTVEHLLSNAQGGVLKETQDIVYREAATQMPALPTAGPRPCNTDWCETLHPDPVLLFRYSALTMNSHRIHYDRTYALEEEFYPALVVHGPLQACLLATMAHRNLGRPLKTFSFRGQSPAFDGIDLHICGNKTEDGATLWTEQGGAHAMTAVAT